MSVASVIVPSVASVIVPSVRLGKDHGLTRDLEHTRPADILIQGRPAALDIPITSPLCPAILGESCHQDALQMRLASSTRMDPNAKSWAGPAFHWQWRHMAIGAKRPRIPSPGWHLTFTSSPRKQNYM
ncbi:hypothetical protein EMCRGX_G012199 [Ephydatia muelleri]